MNLKKHFHIVVDKRKFGGEITAVSVNKLHLYIPEKRANYIKAKLHELTVDKRRYSVQNVGVVDVYVK